MVPSLSQNAERSSLCFLNRSSTLALEKYCQTFASVVRGSTTKKTRTAARMISRV